MTARKCILLFIKSPEKGMVKSRLAKDVNESMALSLYKHFVLDILETIQAIRYPVKICYYPPDALAVVSAWLGSRYSYIPQKGRDLGERMTNAFLDTFAEAYSSAALIGSDIPDLTVTTVEQALHLEHFDAAIGPSRDGGYYLIGFKKDTFLPAVFEKMPWGTERVFSKTMKVFRKRQYIVNTLPEMLDIDRIEDLLAFAERGSRDAIAGSGTRQFIRDNFDALFGKALKQGNAR